MAEAATANRVVDVNSQTLIIATNDNDNHDSPDLTCVAHGRELPPARLENYCERSFKLKLPVFHVSNKFDSIGAALNA